MEARITCQYILFFVGIAAASDYHLLILHQGDIHSRYRPVGAYFREYINQKFQRSATPYGGFTRAVEYVKSVKKHAYTPNVLVVNIGDFFCGEMMHIVFKWKVSAELAKQMPYDVLALGDKEFEGRLEELLLFMRSLPHNVFVCTNMDFSNFNSSIRDELEKLCPRHRIITIGGKKVGVVSYLTPHAMAPKKVSELRLEDEIAALTREVAVLREKGVKLFVALGHSGYERDQEVARRVPSLDVIVGGHSHTLLWPDRYSHKATGKPPDPMDTARASGPYPTVVVQPSGRRVLILHASWGGKYVGNINITFNADDEVKHWWAQPKLLDMNMPEDPATKALVDNFTQQIEDRADEVIGNSLVQLVGVLDTCSQAECNLANLFADAMLWALRSYAPDVPMELPVVSMVNCGLIGNMIQLGNVTRRMVADVLWWRNLIDAIVINGSTLHAALEHGASTIEDEGRGPEGRDGRFLQVSGISYTVNMSLPRYQRVSNVNILCVDNVARVPLYQPLNKSHKYHVAAPNYIIDGGDGFDMLPHYFERQRFGLLDLDILINYITKTSPVYSILESRITVIWPPEKETDRRQLSAGGRHGWPGADQRALLLTAAILLVSATAAAAAAAC